jgi:uncharacterized membrane protein YphA (DoxX/SURF4 family)
MTKLKLGRHVFGLAAIGFGVFALAFRDFNTWQQIRALGNVPHREILVYIVAAVEIFGGVAIQGRATARGAAIALGTLYFIFALLWVPFIVARPLIYGGWGNFFEQFSMVAGAMIMYASFGLGGREDAARSEKVARIGYYSFAISVVSFTLEQVFYLSDTAEFVPKWIPPGQMFWAVVTTIAFALAASALLSGRFALLAAQLLTVMILGFGVLIWLPAPLGDRHSLTNWAGNAENLGIAAAAWIVADYLAQRTAPPASNAA